MLVINTKDIILANIIAAILHAEITDKIISKGPVLTSELYGDLAFTMLNASAAYITMNQYIQQSQEDKDSAKAIQQKYKKYDIIDLTSRDEVLKYIENFVNEHCKEVTIEELHENKKYVKTTCYLMENSYFNNLPMHYQLFVSHTDPKCILNHQDV